LTTFLLTIPIINYTVIGYQSSVISHQLSVITYQKENVHEQPKENTHSNDTIRKVCKKKKPTKSNTYMSCNCASGLMHKTDQIQELIDEFEVSIILFIQESNDIEKLAEIKGYKIECQKSSENNTKGKVIAYVNKEKEQKKAQ